MAIWQKITPIGQKDRRSNHKRGGRGNRSFDNVEIEGKPTKSLVDSGAYLTSGVTIVKFNVSEKCLFFSRPRTAKKHVYVFEVAGERTSPSSQ